MANITTQTIRVDLSTGKIIPTAYTHQNDTARTLVFDMYNGGMPYTMTGNTVKFAYKSPIVNGQYSVIAGASMASGTVSGNKVTVTLPVAYTQISGVGMLTMVITPTSGTVRPVNIRLVVQKSADGSDVMAAASDFPDAWMDEKIYSWLDDHIDGIFTEEQFADSVDNWLDDHPEATTTIEDGSITYAKLNSNINSGFVLDNGTYKYDYNGLVNKPHIATCTVPTFEDLYDTTEDEVTVLEDNSYLGSGETVTFMKADVELSTLPHLQRANGDYMIPKPRHDPVSSCPPLVSIGEVVGSYINKSNLVYGNTHGLFDEDCTNEIDCAGFSQAVFQGITYEKSRYNGNASNTIGDYVGNNIPRNIENPSSTRPYGYKASIQALWFAEQNRLFYIDYEKEHPCSQLQPGDILFESELSQIPPRTYLNIGHVVVVLAVFPDDDKIMIAQGGNSHAGVVYSQPQGPDMSRNVCKITTLKIGDNPQQHIVFARPCYGLDAKSPKTVVSQYVSNGNGSISPSTQSRRLGTIYTDFKLDKNKLYTFVARGTLPQYSTQKANLRLFAGQDMAVSLYMDCGEQIAIPFVPFENIDQYDSIGIDAYFINDDFPSITETFIYRITEISIFEGLAPGAEPNVFYYPNGFTAASGVTVTYSLMWRDDAGLHWRAALKLASAQASGADVTLGTIDSEIFPKRSHMYTIPVNYSGSTKPLSISTAGSVSTYYATGEGAGSNLAIDIVI